MTSSDHHYLVRFAGDVGTKKGRALIQFRARLAKNIKAALQSEGIPHKVKSTRGRLYVTSYRSRADDVLARVFGLQSFSPIETRPFTDLDDVVRDGEAIFGEEVEGKTFAVRARRSSIRHKLDFTSENIERALGSRLLDRSAGVDLSNPEVTVQVELTSTGAHYYRRVVKGSGGLPLGCEGRALTLVSGGIDSAVAAWYLLKRGIELDYLFYNLGDAAHAHQVTEIVKVLADRWSYGSRPRLYVVDLRPWVDQLRECTDPALWQVLLKRLMILGANRLLAQTRCLAIVTGESLGQVSSQTLTNLAVIEELSDAPILRPLVGFDKVEIVSLARRIGTFEMSARVQEYCALQGRGPTAAATLDEVLANESQMDLGDFAAQFDTLEALDLCGDDVNRRPADSAAVEAVPADATVIDLRPSSAFRTWHYPGATRLDYDEALKAAPHLPTGQTYLVCCEVEFKSAAVVELLREAGRRAYYFRGGTSKMMRYAESQDLVDLASVAPAFRK